MPGTAKTSSAWPLVLLAFLFLLGFHLLVIFRPELDPNAVGYNAIQYSQGQFLTYLAYLLLGGAAALALAWAPSRHFAANDLFQRVRAFGAVGSDRAFLVLTSLLAFVVAVVCRAWVLQSMPLVDDEKVYRFAAQILATGRLDLPGNPDPFFFEHPFIVHGDKVFTQYFLGWPALMLPFLLLGIEDYANAFYFALSMPPIFFFLRRLCGSRWARLGPLLAVLSPILSISAATLLSHSSCILALAYFSWCALRCQDPESHWGWHTGMALAFSAAFFIRPLSAIGVGLPWLLAWLWDLKERPRPWRTFLAFALPALLGALLFLGINQAMNGHPLRIAYSSYLDYAKTRAFAKKFTPPPEVAFDSPVQGLDVSVAAFLRLNFATLGWPTSWLFVFVAGRGRARALLLASLGTFFAANFFTTAVGVDGYGPMHFLELALPIVLLTVLGLARATERAAPSAKALPLALALASSLAAVTAYLPYQVQTLREMTALERVAREIPPDLRKPAVIFAEKPWEMESCKFENLRPWVYGPPMFDPDLRSEVLWLINVTPEKNREFARRRFPDRAAYLARWLPGCRRLLVPLDELPLDAAMPEAPSGASGVITR